MNKYLFAIWIFIIPFWVYARQWTLEECVEHALANNAAIRLQIQNLIADSARLYGAYGDFFPDLSASASSGVSATPFVNDRDPVASISVGISSSVVILDGRRRRNRLFSAEKTLTSSEISLETEKQNIISSITRAFISLLQAQEILQNTKGAVALSQKQMEFQQNLQEIGKATQLALTRSRAQLAQSQHSLTIAQNSFNNAVLEMKRLLELDFESDFSIIHPNTDFETRSGLSPSQIFEDNRDIFFSISSAEVAVEIAEISLALARAQKSPTLSAGAGVSTGMRTSTPHSGDRQLREGVSPNVSLNLRVPIIDNRSARTNVAVAQSNLNRAKITLERTERNVRSEIEQLVADITASQSRFATALERFEAEAENMQTVDEMRNIGNITAIDYASQQNNFLLAQSELTQARFSLMLSQKLLDIYLGLRFE
ncbi:MAG: TolC family protein [Chitinivibrionia bacterium]|nr:TolC family protein [Chitinivibrionia bacterium]